MNSPGIVNSAGIGMNLYASANPLGYGAGPGVYQLQSGTIFSSTTTPDHTFFGSGDPIQVNVSYDGSTYLSATFLDLSTGTSYSESYYIGDLTSITGGSTAYVGFSGGDGGSTSTQTISNFIFSYNTGAFTNVLPVTTALSISAGATLDLAGNSQTVGSLTGSGTVANYTANALSVLTAAATIHRRPSPATLGRLWNARPDQSRFRQPDADRLEQRLLGRHDRQRRHSASGQRNDEERQHGGRHPQ